MENRPGIVYRPWHGIRAVLVKSNSNRLSQATCKEGLSYFRWNMLRVELQMCLSSQMNVHRLLQLSRAIYLSKLM